jgi:hypothetical protein
VELILGASELSSSYVVCGSRKLFTDLKGSKKLTKYNSSNYNSEEGPFYFINKQTQHLIQEYM